MSFTGPKSPALVLIAACFMGMILATPAGAAKQPVAKQSAPRLSGLKAQVGQGGRVDLVASSLTGAELAALRPNFENLKPRARTNAE